MLYYSVKVSSFDAINLMLTYFVLSSKVVDYKLTSKTEATSCCY